MTRIHASTLACLVLFAAVAAPTAAKPKPPRFEYDKSFDFKQLHTFDIRIHESKQREGVMQSSVVPHLVKLLEDLMIAKGFTIDTENPDFVLTWDTALADDYSSTSWVGHGEVAKGFLILRTTVPTQKEPFWLGAETAEVTGRITPDKAWKKVEPATRRILAAFPPPPGG